MAAPIANSRQPIQAAICRQYKPLSAVSNRCHSHGSRLVHSTQFTQCMRPLSTPSSHFLPQHILPPGRFSQFPASRTYYTANQPTQSIFTTTQTIILQASLAHVADHGFTTAALLHGIEDCGYLPATTNLFPRGPIDLIFFHMISARQALAGALPLDEAVFQHTSSPPSKASIQERTLAILLHRLRANAPYNQHIPAAIAQLAQPTYVPAALADLAELADEVVYLSGTLALDTSWYTRRAGIAAVYAATELFMTQDVSEGFRETEGFLRRRLDGLDRAAWALDSVGEWVGFTTGSAFNLLRSWGVRI